jgi:hypothetical protein
MAAALSRVYAGLCRRDRLTSKECPFWLYLFCGSGVISAPERSVTFLALCDRYFVLDRKLLKFNVKIYYQKFWTNTIAMSVCIYETVKAALENDERQNVKDIEADLKKRVTVYRSFLLKIYWALYYLYKIT